jgi:hypothetical protein
MFIAIAIFLNIATGVLSTMQAQNKFETIEACQALVDHDLPLMKASAEKLYPGEFEITGKCVPAPDDGSI